MIRFSLLLVLLFAACSELVCSEESQSSFWKLESRGISLPGNDTRIRGHKDHFAMSGRSVDLILEWQVDGQGAFTAKRWVRWPMLRTIPNNTHASFNHRFSYEEASQPRIAEKPLTVGLVQEIRIDGLMEVKSTHSEGLLSTRRIFPSSYGPAVIDYVTLENVSERPLDIIIPGYRKSTESSGHVRGTYVLEEFITGEGCYTLAPGEKLDYALVCSAREKEGVPYFDHAGSEYAARLAFIEEMKENLVLATPEPVLDRMFQFAKIRATESIFSTRGGLMHAPGGYNKFLAALWANDQAEYVNPFFPFLGNALGNESAMNCFRWYARFMNDEYQPIPSSIISEGEGTWQGAGDRGDAAMIAHGASRFALASGNPELGRELMPLIEWCLEYSRRKINADGVVESQSDELEGRFPSGKANLCTNILYYDALLVTASLARELGSEKAEVYRKEAESLKKAIGKYFEGNVEGFETYKYYENNDKLRSWICMPLLAGMTDRAEATVEALFSPRLWFGHGMLTESGSKTYWDRSALYAFRGIFAAGYQDRALEKLTDYSLERLLGSHVPYAIEAWPEAGQSQLSAESGLYARIFTEGMFGITPTGFRSFSLVPRLPSHWNSASLRNIKAFGSQFNIELTRTAEGIEVLVTDRKNRPYYHRTLSEGEKHEILLNQLHE